MRAQAEAALPFGLSMQPALSRREGRAPMSDPHRPAALVAGTLFALRGAILAYGQGRCTGGPTHEYEHAKLDYRCRRGSSHHCRLLFRHAAHRRDAGWHDGTTCDHRTTCPTSTGGAASPTSTGKLGSLGENRQLEKMATGARHGLPWRASGLHGVSPLNSRAIHPYLSKS
jgi:hypothetical protein